MTKQPRRDHPELKGDDFRIVAELPKLTGPELQQIAEKAEFLAGLDEGLRQIAEGKLIPHEQVRER